MEQKLEILGFARDYKSGSHALADDVLDLVQVQFLDNYDFRELLTVLPLQIRSHQLFAVLFCCYVEVGTMWK